MEISPSLISFLLLALIFYSFIRISQKAGYSWLWAFLMFVPIVNFVIFCFFAFKVWPIEKELFYSYKLIAYYKFIISKYGDEYLIKKLTEETF